MEGPRPSLHDDLLPAEHRRVARIDVEAQVVHVVLDAPVDHDLRDVRARRGAVEGEPGDAGVDAEVVAVADHEEHRLAEAPRELRQAPDEPGVRVEPSAVGAIVRAPEIGLEEEHPQEAKKISRTLARRPSGS